MCMCVCTPCSPVHGASIFRSRNLTSAVAPLARYCRGAFINGPVRMCVALLYWGLIGFVIALCFVPGVTKLELLAALVAMKVVHGRLQP